MSDEQFALLVAAGILALGFALGWYTSESMHKRTAYQEYRIEHANKVAGR